MDSKMSLFTDFLAPEIIKARVRKRKAIIHGGQSLLAQSPIYNRGYTADIDIFFPKSRKLAREIEQDLDRNAGEDRFGTKQSKMHKGTYKVYNKQSGLTIADITRSDERVPFRTLDGIRYSTLAFEAKKKREILRQKEFAFRHEKSRESLNRMRINRFFNKRLL